MAKKIKNLSLATMTALALAMAPLSSWAQAQSPAGTTEGQMTGTRKQIATIVFSGLAGAILGLSTLSFYGRPQDHLSNIAVGFAIGVIGGAVYTTYKAATRPYEAYDMSEMFHDEEYKRYQMQEAAQRPLLLSYSWEL